jgi:hypothetical protein
MPYAQKLLSYAQHFWGIAIIRINITYKDKLLYREVLSFVNRFTALHFTATGALPAVRPIRIFPMNQYACWPITFGKKVVKIHRSQKVLNMLPSAYRYFFAPA